MEVRVLLSAPFLAQTPALPSLLTQYIIFLMVDQAYENFSEEDLEKERILSELTLAMEQDNADVIIERTNELHPADIAEYIQNLNDVEREQYITAIKDDFDPEILTELEPEQIEQVTEILGTKESAGILAQLDTDLVVEFVEELEEKEQQEIMDALPELNRAAVEEGLSYPDDSIGRLMRKRFVTVPEYWNVGQVIDYMRSHDDLPDDFHVIYIVDPKQRPVQYVLTSRIMRNEREVLITDIAQECKHLLAPATDQEEAAYLFQKYGLVSLAIVNKNGKMIGVLTTQDIVEVIQEESEEDFMRLGGVASRDFYSKIYKVVGKRTPWLLISAVNAFIASFVIISFADSIKAIVALAALSPMVAGLAGNAGSQTLTVTISAIAKRKITSRNSRRFIGREMVIGLTNGIIVGAFSALGVFIFYHDAQIAMIFAVSIVACFFGTGLISSAIPIALEKFGFDPTTASSAFVIALTDIISFFIFLGLATILLIN